MTRVHGCADNQRIRQIGVKGEYKLHEQQSQFREYTAGAEEQCFFLRMEEGKEIRESYEGTLQSEDRRTCQKQRCIDFL